MDNSELRNFAKISGIVGLVGGILLFLWLFTAVILAGIPVNITGWFFFLLKVSILVIGIMGLKKFKEVDEITTAPSVLLIVGGAVGIIPFFGWIGGIISIIGGAIYLSQLKNFDN